MEAKEGIAIGNCQAPGTGLAHHRQPAHRPRFVGNRQLVPLLRPAWRSRIPSTVDYFAARADRSAALRAPAGAFFFHPPTIAPISVMLISE